MQVDVFKFTKSFTENLTIGDTMLMSIFSIVGGVQGGIFPGHHNGRQI